MSFAEGINAFLHRFLSKQDAIRLLELIHSSLACTEEKDFRELMGGLGSLISYDSATCVFTRLGSSGIKEPYEVVNINYPEEWVELYVERKYHQVDPIIKENFTRFSLQHWSETYASYKPPKDFLCLAEDFGLRDGYTHGARNFNLTEGSLFSFSGNHLEHNSRSEAIIKLVVPHLHQVIARIVEHRRLDKDIALTVREKEVLKWIGQGKSTWDISVILGISERTVKFHVRNIMQKLDVVSRAQAVAVAVEQGMIYLE